VRFAHPAAALAAAGLAGCGSSAELPPAAEPAKSPVAERAPAGSVVPIGHKPEGLVADVQTGLLAVGLTRPDRLALVDMRTLRLVRAVDLPGAPRHLALARRGGPVLVPAENSDQLVEVPLRRGPIRTVRVGRQPHDAAAAAGRTFVGDELGDTLSVVARGRVIRELPAPVQPGGVAVDDSGRGVAVVGVRGRELALYDTRTLRTLGKIPVGVGPTHVIGSGGRFFVVDTRGNGLLEVLLDPKLRIHRRTAIAGTPYAIAADRVRRRYWVTQTALNRVSEVTDRRILRSFPTVRQPNSVAVDQRTGRVFVASRADGTLQAFDPPAYRRAR
jgi:DNA-binding beta-propeller fold protein YncE